MFPVKKSIAGLLAFLCCTGPLGAEYPWGSRVMSIWGHPVITIGWTPYDVQDPGNYNGVAGSPGFIPGYGNYPGIWPSKYPWMDGPGTPFDRRKLLQGNIAPTPPVEEEQPPADAALLIVKIPAEAELWINDVKASQEGSYRRFQTPTLPADRDLTYTLKVYWRVKDAQLTRTEKVQVHAGGKATVNFLTPDSWTGQRVETLPLPRKAPTTSPASSTLP
jgi:uncharacterized protein (TIGR03000 family)